MRKFLITILLLISTKLVFAENWICYDGQTKSITQVVQGDCKRLGLCSGFNNQGLQDNCFEASQDEYEKAGQSQVKIDPSVVSGNKVVDFTKEEKDAITLEEKNKSDEINAIRQALVDKLKGLGITDEEIIFILN